MTDDASKSLSRKRGAVEVIRGGDARSRDSKASRHHPDITSAVLRSQDPFIQALADVRQAIERASRLGKERLVEVDQRYYSGVKTRQGMIAEHAFRWSGASARGLDGLLFNLWSKVNSAPIYKLPVEVMCSILSCLDMDSLFSCPATCRFWASILASNATQREVWNGTSVDLWGSLEEVNRRWAVAHKNRAIPERLSLQINSVRSNTYDNTEEEIWATLTTDGFSSSVLRELIYGGSPYYFLDMKVWKSLRHCSNLKVLHWTMRHEHDDYIDTYDYDIESAICRLEELRLNSTCRLRIDIAFVQMLSQVKRLHVDSGLSVDHILAILDAAEAHLEVVEISQLYRDGRSLWKGPALDTTKSFFVLNNVRSFSLLTPGLYGVRFSAPHATSLRLGDAQAIDCLLLNSCRERLKSLHIDFKGESTRSKLDHELFDMPQLNDLYLNYTRGKRSSYSNPSLEILGHYREYSIASFWEAICKGSLEITQNILPQLRRMTVIHDPLLDEDTILNFVEARRLGGQPALEQMSIYLANHCSHHSSRLDNLQKVTPGFVYMRFEDWTHDEREWWTLETKLRFGSDIHWTSIDTCRSLLKSLDLQGQQPDERLEQELFDMPQLEILTLHFVRDTHEEWSVPALWAAMSSRILETSKLSLRDILPVLNKLTVHNDALLNADLIVKLIEARESLDLAPIGKVHITLAKKYSEDSSRLEALKKTMPGFSFGVYPV